MLLQETIQERLRMLEEAATYQGRPRERLVAVSEADELFARLYPQQDRALQAVRTASQLGQIPPQHAEAISQADNRMVGLLMGIIRDAVRSGDLDLPSSLSPEEMAFSLWALGFGVRALMRTRTAWQQSAIMDNCRVGRESLDMLLDSLGWGPLASEFDYEQTRQQVQHLLSPPGPHAATGTAASRLTWHRTRLQTDRDTG